MKTSFPGANYEITGSDTLSKSTTRHILVDCGKVQGACEQARLELPTLSQEYDL